MNLNHIYNELMEAELETANALPRSERLIQIATSINMPTTELVHLMAKNEELEVLEDFELIENPTATIPLRLIHEYQCVPILKAKTSEIDAAKDGPIPYSTRHLMASRWTDGSLDICSVRT